MWAGALATRRAVSSAEQEVAAAPGSAVTTFGFVCRYRHALVVLACRVAVRPAPARSPDPGILSVVLLLRGVGSLSRETCARHTSRSISLGLPPVEQARAGRWARLSGSLCRRGGRGRWDQIRRLLGHRQPRVSPTQARSLRKCPALPMSPAASGRGGAYRKAGLSHGMP